MGKEPLGSFVWGVSANDMQYDWEFQVTILKTKLLNTAWWSPCGLGTERFMLDGHQMHKNYVHAGLAGAVLSASDEVLQFMQWEISQSDRPYWDWYN